MHIEIDVSGSDLLKENYSICISDNQGIIRGFKITKDLINSLLENWKKGKYNKVRYSPRAGKFKARIYKVVLRYLLNELFKESKEGGEVSVCFCRDFPSHESGIKQSIEH